MLQQITHYGIHFIVPGVIAYIFFRQNRKKARLIMIATMIIDLDHLFATPIFDPTRCSIGFHPLHTRFAILIYILLYFPKKTRIVGIGLLIHILADSADCLRILSKNA
ncbi:MAG: DUF6122 family protein [Candidatus Absconditabacteria bacterium]|nr:DUF6122 family protein [Candidatus Absconditabacteria bacterium]